MSSVQLVPVVYAAFGSAVILAQAPDVQPATAVGALAASFTVLLTTLVWIVKKQFETNANQQRSFQAALGAQQKAFSDAMDKQNITFSVFFEKVREDNQKVMAIITKTPKSRPDVME